MKSKIQMHVAKHMIAVWLDSSEPTSLKEAFKSIDQCWPMLPRRTLRVWAKVLHKNPERYEFTGYAFKQTELKDHFDEQEIGGINAVLETHKLVNKNNYNDIVRGIIHHKWVYGMNTFCALQYGVAAYFGEPLSRNFRPTPPTLKP